MRIPPNLLTAIASATAPTRPRATATAPRRTWPILGQRDLRREHETERESVEGGRLEQQGRGGPSANWAGRPPIIRAMERARAGTRARQGGPFHDRLAQAGRGFEPGRAYFEVAVSTGEVPPERPPRPRSRAGAPHNCVRRPMKHVCHARRKAPTSHSDVGAALHPTAMASISISSAGSDSDFTMSSVVAGGGDASAPAPAAMKPGKCAASVR